MFTALLVYIGIALEIWWMTLILLVVGLACDAFVVYVIVRKPPLFHSWDKTRKEEIKEIVVSVKHKDD